MKSQPLTNEQLNQLRLLGALSATTEEKAVDGRISDSRAHGLNKVMIGVALHSRKLVARVERPARYGEPRRRLYYLTAAGIEALRDQGKRL